MSQLEKFKLINKIEGISFIILVFIAMPLKYLFDIPMATKIVGMTHGLLVFVFIYQIILAKKEANLSIIEIGTYFALSLVPFGSFYTDKLINQKYNLS